MLDFFRRLFSSDEFMPHGHCYLWRPEIVWLHVISDALVALSYTTIPFTLYYVARKRKDLPFNWMFVCFALFIIACGATHYMEIWTLWTPVYRLSGLVKAITAAASVPTAILLIRLVPQALAIPTPEELSKAHEALQKTHEALETRVQERTVELTAKNEELAKEVAERRHAEAAVRESEARKAAVMEAALDAIVMMDKGVITEFNAAAERIFGYSAEEAIGKPLVDLLVPPSLRGKQGDALRRHLLGEGPAFGRRVEVPALRKDGSEFPAEVAVARIQSQGEPVVVGYIRDITERRQAAEAEMFRRAKDAAEEANAELEAFSYSVAHDLRAPLRAINGFSSLLTTDHAQALGDEAKGYLVRISSGAERMSQLIDALLSLSRLARAEPRRERVDLTQLARKAIGRLREHEPGRAVDFAAQEGLVARGDPQLLGVVLDNLLGNAWKFTGKQPRARIEFGHEEVAGLPAYFVRDNGAGFDPSLVEKLFAPFRRLHSQTEFEGTGIGLATVQRIVRRHGGRVWAEGVENQGATFHFTLFQGLPSGGRS